MEAVVDVVAYPLNRNYRGDEQDQVGEEPKGWERKDTIQLLQEDQLQNLGSEEHKVEEAEYVDELEGSVHGLGILFNFKLFLVELLHSQEDEGLVTGHLHLIGNLSDLLKDWSDDQGVIKSEFIVANGDNDKQGQDDGLAFEARVHALLEDMEVGVVLRLSFDVTGLVEPVLNFDVDVTRRGLVQNLVGCAHLKEASAGVVVTVPNSFDDSLHFRSLDKIEHFKFDSDLE
mmetsp:Transcript_17619/g.27254  ORF Transcript_17619/g.27254 Transcript_17619/m.27254 type:complete len:230 (-) Transcript_17619:1449-2138(-)